jgi:hypothetical protein
MTDHTSFYCIPYWCGMHPMDHFQVGGCWGISYGRVNKEGRDYCRGCGLYRRNLERIKDYDIAIGAGIPRNTGNFTW